MRWKLEKTFFVVIIIPSLTKNNAASDDRLHSKGNHGIRRAQNKNTRDFFPKPSPEQLWKNAKFRNS